MSQGRSRWCLPAARRVDRRGLALARRLNANLLRTWVRQAERNKAPIAIRPTAPSVAIESSESFVPVALPANRTESAIRVELRCKGRTMSLQWPASAAREVRAAAARADEVIRVDAGLVRRRASRYAAPASIRPSLAS